MEYGGMVRNWVISIYLLSAVYWGKHISSFAPPCPDCAAVSDVYLGVPPVMSISDFCLDFPLVWISWGAEATLLYFRRSYTTSHMYHSKSKERNLVQETFMKRIKIHFFFIGSIQFLKLTSQPRIASMGHSRLTRLTEYAKSNYNLTRVLE